MVPASLWLLAGWQVAVGASAQDRMQPAEIHQGNATIAVIFGAGKFDLPRTSLIAWITNAANAVTEYFGRFPVGVQVIVEPVPGRTGVTHGTTYAGRHEAFTHISVGEGTTQKQLDQDPTMTHEFVHMAFPDISGKTDEQHWIEEGMATYIEPIARAQTGEISAAQVWGDFVRDLPKGLPQPGDRGLDGTPTRDRTYWGGAMFWLLADVQIREATHNQKGLQDAMRGIVEAGGNITADWTVEQVIAAGDQATGTHVLAGLYNQMKATAVQTDLADLWRRLGIQVSSGAVTLNDRAPLADIRKAITKPEPSSRP